MADQLLETRYIFIDTQSYHRHGFRFDHPALSRVRELCALGKLHLLITDTVIGEVKNHLKNKITEAANSLSKFQKEALVIKGALSDGFDGLFLRVPLEGMIESGNEIWNNFLADSNAIVISADVVNAKELLELYFSSQAPFSVGKKKHEFPDAISTLSLEAWAKLNNHKIYIISEDSDLEKWCKNKPFAIQIERIDNFVGLYNNAEETLAVLVHALFDKNRCIIEEEIAQSFVECSFHVAGELNDMDAEVDDIYIMSISLDDMNIIDIHDEYAIIALVANINFSASLSGCDYSAGVWDSEDKQYAYLPEFAIDITIFDGFDISMELIFSRDKEEITGAKNILFDGSRDIWIDDGSGYPHKQ